MVCVYECDYFTPFLLSVLAPIEISRMSCIALSLEAITSRSKTITSKDILSFKFSLKYCVYDTLRSWLSRGVKIIQAYIKPIGLSTKKVQVKC